MKKEFKFEIGKTYAGSLECQYTNGHYRYKDNSQALTVMAFDHERNQYLVSWSTPSAEVFFRTNLQGEPVDKNGCFIKEGRPFMMPLLYSERKPHLPLKYDDRYCFVKTIIEGRTDSVSDDCAFIDTYDYRSPYMRLGGQYRYDAYTGELINEPFLTTEKNRDDLKILRNAYAKNTSIRIPLAHFCVGDHVRLRNGFIKTVNSVSDVGIIVDATEYRFENNGAVYGGLTSSNDIVEDLSTRCRDEQGRASPTGILVEKDLRKLMFMSASGHRVLLTAHLNKFPIHFNHFNGGEDRAYYTGIVEVDGNTTPVLYTKQLLCMTDKQYDIQSVIY